MKITLALLLIAFSTLGCNKDTCSIFLSDFQPTNAVIGQAKVTITAPTPGEVKVCIDSKASGKVNFRRPDNCDSMIICSDALCQPVFDSAWNQFPFTPGISCFKLKLTPKARISGQKP